MDTATEVRLSTPWCPGGVFLFIHHLHIEGSLSVGLQHWMVSPSNQCAPLVESWGQISGLSDSVEQNPPSASGC